MPGPVITSEFTSLSVIGHPSIEGFTESAIPTAPNVLFNGVPAVVAGDASAWHTLFIPPNTVVFHPGFFCTPTSPNVLVDGRPVMTATDWYTCFCGFCKPITTLAPNIEIL